MSARSTSAPTTSEFLALLRKGSRLPIDFPFFAVEVLKMLKSLLAAISGKPKGPSPELLDWLAKREEWRESRN